MTGIPGFTGGDLRQRRGLRPVDLDTLKSVRVFDGERVRRLDSAECEFRYRDSIFKRKRSG